MKNKSPPYILTFIICWLLWLLLTASFAKDELITGLLASLVVSLIAAPKMQILHGLRLHLGFFLGLFKYLLYFFVALIKANLDLAKRVLSKEIKINPGIVEIKTTMQSDLGKLFLANSITLTPGTLTVDVTDGRMLVHWIDCPDIENIQASTKTIVANFEKYLKEFVK
jgi:multicomponent Na+:H+ antiporter subunit E